MAEEIHVLFHGKLPNKAALTRSMKELGFPITIADPRESLEKQSGYMPMKLRRDDSGVEFTIFEGRATVEELGGHDVDPRFDRCASFRWGGDEGEMLCGLCAAAGLAKLLAGVVFEEHDAKLLSVEEAVELAKRRLREAKVPEKLPGTRPGDLKRYLKPLLDLRSDLALVGRMLIIRPVRHVLRGVYFDRTGDSFVIRAHRYVQPLYCHPRTLGWAGYVGFNTSVWKPYFQPLLIDALEEVFAAVGQTTALDDFSLWIQSGSAEAKIVNLLLAGKRERALEIVEEIECDGPSEYSARLRQPLMKDVATLCAEHHALEAAHAKIHKLERVWEPSPFPVELPAAQRANRCDEPVFTPTPWITRPEGFLQDLPEHPGDIRFAVTRTWRNGRCMLVVPLTPEQAEARHRANESYLLVARLADGVLFWISRHTGWDPHMPISAPLYRPTPRMRSFDIDITLHGSLHNASIGTAFGWYDLAPDLTGPARQAAIWNAYDVEPEDRRHIFHSEVYERDGSSPIWHCYTHLKEGVRQGHDERKLKAALAQLPAGSDPSRIKEVTKTTETYSQTPLTSEEITLARFSLPPFGEYLDLARRVRELLKVTGFGEIT